MGQLGCHTSFQLIMEKSMNGINNVIVYINDLLIYSQTYEHPLTTLEATLGRLEENNLKVNLAKYLFAI
jgi:hypothetical protein